MLIKNLSKQIVGTYIDKRLVSLRPGNNEVRPEDWEIMKTQKKVAGMLEEDLLIEPAASSPAAAPKVQSLEGFKEKEAIREVKATADVKLLETWYVGEKRKKVLLAIEAQLKALELDPNKKPETGAGDDEDDGDNGEE